MVFLAGTDDSNAPQECNCAVSSFPAPDKIGAPSFWPKNIPAPKTAVGWLALGALATLFVTKVLE